MAGRNANRMKYLKRGEIACPYNKFDAVFVGLVDWSRRWCCCAGRPADRTCATTPSTSADNAQWRRVGCAFRCVAAQSAQPETCRLWICFCPPQTERFMVRTFFVPACARTITRKDIIRAWPVRGPRLDKLLQVVVNNATQKGSHECIEI